MVRRGPEAVIIGAALVVAATVGAIVAWAVLPETSASVSDASPDPSQAGRVADLEAERDRRAAQADAATAYAIGGALDEVTVALVFGPGLSDAAAAQAESAFGAAGADVAATMVLDEAWWAPERVAFRTEIADQLRDSVVGVEQAQPEAVLHHALLQVLLAGAVPDGAQPPPDTPQGPPSDIGATDRVEVLTEVLARAELLALSGEPGTPVDAIVVMVPAGPESGGAVAQRLAEVAAAYAGAVVLVVDGAGADTAASVTAAEAAASRLDGADAPSVVGWDGDELDVLQLVAALVEQRAGGTGTYGVEPSDPPLPTR